MALYFNGKAILAYWMVVIGIFGGLNVLPAQTTGAAFLRLPVGSRAEALGGAYTALSRDANGLYYNPAGLGFGQNRQLMLFHSRWFQDISIENLTFLFPFNGRWTIGSGVTYLHMPDLVRYEIDPTTGGPLENGSFSVYNLVITTGVGFRLNDYLSIGTNIKFFQDHLESVTGQGIAVDVGLQTRLPGFGLSLGLAVQHLGPGVKYIEATEALPTTYRAGLAYRFPQLDGTVAVDVVKARGREMQFLPGVEFGLLNSFYLRGGYQFAEREGSGITAGFGLHLVNDHQVNYVYVPYGDLGDTHRAELIFHLGTAASERPAHRSPATSSVPDKKVRKALADKPSSQRQPSPKNRVTSPSRPQRLVPPASLKVDRLEGNKIKLSWNPLPVPGVKYLIYARLEGRSEWIKVTPQPIATNYQIFNARKTGIRLFFVVTAVKNDQESDFSEPVIIQM
ncbi:MAG: hypothetical protein D6681_10050 [Calditrichaeota bacterium]|nr:MAG: hypothetical protein D6681_10050 [Calditrichota bacterium]